MGWVAGRAGPPRDPSPGLLGRSVGLQTPFSPYTHQDPRVTRQLSPICDGGQGPLERARRVGVSATTRCTEMVGGCSGSLGPRAKTATTATQHVLVERGRRQLSEPRSSSSRQQRPLSATLESTQCTVRSLLVARWSAHLLGRPPAHSATHPVISMCWNSAVGAGCGRMLGRRPKWVRGEVGRRGERYSGAESSHYTYCSP